MATYQVFDPVSQKNVSFMWNDKAEPTDTEIDGILQEARSMAAPRQSQPVQQLDVPKWGAENPNLYGLYGAAKETGKELYKLGSMAGGAIVGSPAGLPGTLVGGGLGYSAAEASLNGGEITLPSFLTGMATEGLGRAVPFLAGKIASPIKAATGMQELQGLANEYNVPLTAAELTQSKPASLFEKALTFIPGSAGEMQRHSVTELQSLMNIRKKLLDEVHQGNIPRANVEETGYAIKDRLDKLLSNEQGLNQQQITGLKNTFLSEMGSSDTYETLGMNAKNILAKRSVEAVQKKNQLYKDVSSQIPQGELETPELSSIAAKHLGAISKLPAQDNTLKSVLSWASKKESLAPEESQLMNEIGQYSEPARKQIMDSFGISENTPTTRTWNTLQDFRTTLNDKIRNEDLSIKMNNPSLRGQLSNEGRIYKELKDALDKDFETIAGKTGSEAKASLDIANAYYGEEYSPIWKSKQIQKLAYSNPEKVIDVAFKSGNLSELKLTKQALGQEGFANLKSGFVNRLIDKATKNGEFSFEGLAKNIANYDKETLGEIFSKGEYERLSQYITAGITQEQKPLLNDFLMKTLKRSGNPKNIVDFIFQPNNSYNISLARRTLGNDLFQQAKGVFTEKLFQENAYGLYEPLKSVRGASKFTDKDLSAIYSPGELKLTKDLLTLSKASQSAERISGNPSGTAQSVITFESGRAVFKNPVTGIWYWITPAALAKAYTSKAGTQYLSEGLRLSNTSKNAIGIATRLMAIKGVEPLEQRPTGYNQNTNINQMTMPEEYR